MGYPKALTNLDASEMTAASPGARCMTFTPASAAISVPRFVGGEKEIVNVTFAPASSIIFWLHQGYWRGGKGLPKIPVK